jgi:hypothetical protein
LVDCPVLIGSHGLAPAGPQLTIAEGIENALTIIAATGMPAWPSGSKGGFKSLALTTAVRAVPIVADNDAMDKARCPHAVLANAGPPRSGACGSSCRRALAKTSTTWRGLGDGRTRVQCNNNAEKIHSPQPQPNGRDPAPTPDLLPGASMLNKQKRQRDQCAIAAHSRSAAP